MKESQYTSLAIKAMDFVKSGRSEEEKNAYLQGVEDALKAVYEDTGYGVFPARTACNEIEELFEEGEQRRKAK